MKINIKKTQSLLWLAVRLYVGWIWLEAGWGKIVSPAWTGDASGTALSGFVRGALAQTSGAHPDVSMWYAAFLEHCVLPYSHAWSYFVAYGEVLVGIALILGIFTGVAAFFGAFMNFNYLLAGTISTNPILLVLSIGIMWSGKCASVYGFDESIKKYLRNSSFWNTLVSRISY